MFCPVNGQGEAGKERKIALEKRIAQKVSEEDAGMVLGQFLRSRMALSKKEISRSKFLEDGICVNGVRKKVTAVLGEGELVEVRLESGERTSPQLASSENELVILYEDEDVIVLDKPAGLAVHPAGRSSLAGDTLANRLACYLRAKHEDGVIRIFGRLDKDTSGVVLAAKSRTAAGRLERQREAGSLTKTYLAVCCGVPPEMEGEICAPLKASPENRSRMLVSEDGKYARTWYRVLRSWEKNDECGEASWKYSLVRLRLETGRMHQIRVHMAYIGCPLLGDPIYADAANRKPPLIDRTALHAAELKFCQPFTGERVQVLAPVPKDIARILDVVIE